MRALRLVLGIWALVQAFTQQDVIVGLLGGFLLLTALANIGCCGSRGCAIDHKRKADSTHKEIKYEELDTKK